MGKIQFSKPSKLFKEFKNPKQTAIYGTVAAFLSIVLAPFWLYSIAIILGIYGTYHSSKQKNWPLLAANIFVVILAIGIKATFHTT